MRGILEELLEWALWALWVLYLLVCLGLGVLGLFALALVFSPYWLVGLPAFLVLLFGTVGAFRGLVWYLSWLTDTWRW